jgi:hypothetical protein
VSREGRRSGREATASDEEGREPGIEQLLKRRAGVDPAVENVVGGHSLVCDVGDKSGCPTFCEMAVNKIWKEQSGMTVQT